MNSNGHCYLSHMMESADIAAFHLLAKMSVIKDRTQETTQLAKLHAVILVLDVLANQQFHLHISYKLLGHCLKIVPFREKQANSRTLLLHSENLNQLHISSCIKVTIQCLAQTLHITLGVIDTTYNKQAVHFTPQNMQCQSFGKGIQQNFHVPSWSQIAGLIGRYNGLLK